MHCLRQDTWARVPPKIRIDPPLQTLRPGDTSYLECVAFDESSHSSITWTRIGSEMPAGITINEDVVKSNDGHLRMSRITFHGILFTDAGKYLCTAVNAAGKVEAIAEIIVDDERFNNLLIESVLLGSSINLKCPTEFVERDLHVVWNFDDTDSLPDNVRILNNEITINNIKEYNVGNYICTVHWNDSIIEENCIVINLKEPTLKICRPDQLSCNNGEQCIDPIQRCNQIKDCDDGSDEFDCKPKSINKISINADKSVIHLNDQLHLTCQIQGDTQKEYTAKWNLISSLEPMHPNVQIDKNKLYIEDVEYENGGIYRCSVEDHDGLRIEADYLLVIQVEKRFIALGDNLTLSCSNELDKSTSVSYSWRKYAINEVPAMANETISSGAIIYPNGTLMIPNVTISDTGTYICTATDQQTTIQLPTMILLEGLVPRFHQKPLSYLSLPTLKNAYFEFEITLSIKPEWPDGLILYNSQKLEKGADFISLGLKDSYIEFRIELGGGVTALRSAEPLDLNMWHKIHIKRNRNIFKLSVDQQDIVSTSSSPKFVGLDLTEPMYIGNVPNIQEISSFNGFDRGFIGCISLFETNSIHFDLIKNSTQQYGVGRCTTCSSDSCLNGGTCSESSQLTMGYECNCPEGFYGDHCEKFSDACYPGLCNDGHCLNQDNILDSRKFFCECHFGKIGRYCEQSINIIEPQFIDGAYLAFRTPNNLLNRLDIKIKVKPNFSLGSNHLILYCGQYANGTGDFAALLIVNRTVQFRFDTGSGVAILKSSKQLVDNEWIDILIQRNKKEALLTIDNIETVAGRSSGKNIGLNIHTPLYVGGFNRSKISLPNSLAQITHLNGCIRQLEINGKDVGLLKRYIESSNVENCGIVSLCQQSPCLNGGNCLEINQTTYECFCQDDFMGDHCELEKGVCERTNPCLNKAECENQSNSFTCHCTIGFSGQKCQNKVEFTDTKSAFFNGQSFISFDNSYLTKSTQNYIEIKFKIRTLSKNGLIFFFGDLNSENDNQADFLSVFINDSRLIMNFELGSGQGHIDTDFLINDYNFHQVSFKLQDKEGMIKIDDMIWNGKSSGNKNTLNTGNSDIYFGGLPVNLLIKPFNFNQYLHGFHGCLSDLELNLSNVLDLVENSKRTRNLMPCQQN